MMGKWTTIKCVVLCILLSWTWATPLQKSRDDSDEADSDENEQKSSLNSQGNQNETDQELANKATLFLTRYFSNHGTEVPLHIPTNIDKTIVITVVSNNASDTDSSKTQGDNSINSAQKILQQQYQQILQEEIHEQQLEQQLVQVPSHISEPVKLTPLKNLFGFVTQDKLNPENFRRATEEPDPSTSTSTTTKTTTTTTTTTKTTVKNATTTAPPTENFEKAVLEAISNAKGESLPDITSSTFTPIPHKSTSPANKIQNLIDSGIIPGITNSNTNDAIKVPSNFGPVFIQSADQTTAPSGGTNFVNFITPAPPPPAPQALPVQLQPNIIFLQPALPPPPSNIILNENAAIQPRPQPARPAVNALSDIIGSLAHGNLSGVVQNSIKLAGVPVVQDAAKLASFHVLQNVFQGLNPCNLLGCNRQRPATLKRNDIS